MSKRIERATEGAAFGGMLGVAIGTILTGVTLALPGINIVLAPIVAAATVSTVSVSCGAVGTVLGAAGGAISSSVEDTHERYQTAERNGGEADQISCE